MLQIGKKWFVGNHDKKCEAEKNNEYIVGVLQEYCFFFGLVLQEECK